jgi:hypothetical protein
MKQDILEILGNYLHFIYNHHNMISEINMSNLHKHRIRFIMTESNRFCDATLNSCKS